MNRFLLSLTCLITGMWTFPQSATQTRTATHLYMSRPAVWQNATWQQVRYDDNVYMSTIKGVGTTYFTSLEGFNFSVPSNAIINNFTITFRRFKTGRGNAQDKLVSILWPAPDGTYAVGNAPNYAKTAYWPGTESVAVYIIPASGPGVDGVPYNVTASQVNSPLFGVVFEFGALPGAPIVINIDQVTMTVSYTVPITNKLQLTQSDNNVMVSAQQAGLYTLSVRNQLGQLLQRSVVSSPKNMFVALNNRCKGLCIITLEGVNSRKTIKAFVR